jgi:hypothetical protein
MTSELAFYNMFTKIDTVEYQQKTPPKFDRINFFRIVIHRPLSSFPSPFRIFISFAPFSVKAVSQLHCYSGGSALNIELAPYNTTTA